ncbi:MAG: 4Fe-4S binding protein [Candidatus Cloacimonadaceae bacterium]|jgi:ferredoxin|nr:4Fe-4S binding protein [Candidatus Cloacimonadota bacterium]MDY0127149.1 4Fe-4S binding protein [Candidatus Cloacimonadaceae bacterium]MCB5255173.1 4Fe-4S binding protein [Candidatus Cloacimonadota bacterium]MCK9177646.1 4Fe-4S binding protein [Candidatus Cloacimonadota bacterium]MCK9242631.1 4Fe-4S binding protein [Candidatus Cloacimonadota bacterium]
MKRALQIIIIILLLAIVIIQILSLTGRITFGEEQEVCPVNAITMKDGKAVIDSIKCIGCRRCVDGFIAIPWEDVYPPEDLLQTDTIAQEEPEANPAPIQTEAAQAPVNPPAKSLEKTPEVQDKQSQEASSIDVESTQAIENPERNAHYVVDAEGCITCNRCLRVCPEDAISYQGGKAYIDPEKCTNCGICAGLEPDKFRGCPVGVIHPAL